MSQLGLTAEDEMLTDAADGATFAALPPDGTRISPRATPNAVAMPKGTAMRIVRLFLPRRRDRDP